MSRKTRHWHWISEDDPLSGMANMVDLWVVFAVALLLALVGRAGRQDAPLEAMKKLDRFTVGEDRLTGAGERLGTAYRLESGEVVYVPDGPQPPLRSSR